MILKINNSWDEILKDEFNKEYFKELTKKIDDEYKNYVCHPDKENIFNAFKLTEYENIKVVILGQDPYHNYDEAVGLAFSVKKETKIPPSLKNIYKEMNNDIGDIHPKYGDLTSLTKEGVFLLNTTLSVRHNEPLSHYNIGWETFTDQVISLINNKTTPVVFILWGRSARSKKYLITNKIHLVIESSHPSPLSAYNGFFGSKPFSRTNEFLINNKMLPINWSVIE